MEIFLELERLAVHPRCRHKDGRRIKIDAHFPPASQAYYEATPQKLLSQARFIHADLHQLVLDLFNTDVYGNIRVGLELARKLLNPLVYFGTFGEIPSNPTPEIVCCGDTR